jgi:hypothetical protein
VLCLFPGIGLGIGWQEVGRFAQGRGRTRISEKHTMKTVSIAFVTMFCLICLPLPAVLAETLGVEQRIQIVQQDLLALERGRVKIAAAHQRQNIAVSSQEESDYQLFMGFLEGRMDQHCQDLFALGGANALQDMPCRAPMEAVAGSRPYSSIPGQPPPTDGEIALRLDQEFRKSLGEFDDQLLKEQEKIASLPRNSKETGVMPQMEKGGSSSVKATTRPQTSQGERGGTQPSGQTTETASKEVGIDDDIVARQLREAAEQETDPQVKEKLWEEYRKYKKATR